MHEFQKTTILYGVYGVSSQSCWWHLHYMQGLSGFCVFMGAYYSTAIQIFLYDGFSFLCAFICMGVAFFSNISPHNKISRYVLWCCVVVSVVLQCAGMLLVQAWKWPLPALVGALFVIQYLSCYLAGLIQRDIQDEKLDDKFLYVFPQFWIQVPLTAVGWFFMSGYY